jgi:hypothetical protein
MLRRSTYALMLLILPANYGCHITRSVEQWKCDRFGMCHFGITPSVVPPAFPPDTGQTSGPSLGHPGQ